MKLLWTVFFILTGGLNVFAADRKMGNVILVERELQDIYSQCLKNTDTPQDKPQNFFACSMKYTSAGEVAVSSGIVLRLMDQRCSVVGEALKGTLLITFATSKNPSTFEAARECLSRAITNLKDPVKALVYSYE